MREGGGDWRRVEQLFPLTGLESGSSEVREVGMYKEQGGDIGLGETHLSGFANWHLPE